MLGFETFAENLGTNNSSGLIGIFVGLLFGVFAQQSRFCLRSACIEFWRGEAATRFAIWLLTFSSALLLTQLFVASGHFDLSAVRQLTAIGTLSGAIIGGAMFGVGMILARGCASRLLVLSATGNLRALVAGLVVTISAQASLRGVLSPTRATISDIALISAQTRDMSNYLPSGGGIYLGLVLAILAIWLAVRSKTGRWIAFASIGVGATIALGWILTNWHASVSFDIIPVKSVSFTGPSADTLMGLINSPSIVPSFDIGLVPGVFAGSLLAALVTREFKIQAFNDQSGLVRYLIGAALMGFGGMLAGGCAVGAGVTGGSVLSLTGWVALFFMWLFAGLTDALVDHRNERKQQSAKAPTVLKTV